MSSCVECGTKLAKDDEGEVFCPKCGLVDSYVPTQIPNWKAFGTPEEDTTSGAPMDKFGYGASTEISFQGDFDGKEYGKWKRLRRIDNEKRGGDNTVDRNIYKANIMMIRMKSSLNIPTNISKTAMDMYSKAARNGYLRGRTIYGTLCATVYASYRAHGVTIILRDFARQVNLDKTVIGGYYRGLKDGGFVIDDGTNRVFSLISKVVEGKHFSGEVEAMSKEIYVILERSKLLTGKSPSTIACSILYMVNVVAGLGMIQRDISFLCGVTEVSLRNNTNKFKKLLMFDVGL
jgi:transcription initiation factor TFIIB